jgi:hypothetical protein
MFNIKYDALDTIKKIRATALANLAAGVVITEFISEGNQFQGVITAPTGDVLLATELYLDEFYGELITETTPNFYSCL